MKKKCFILSLLLFLGIILLFVIYKNNHYLKSKDTVAVYMNDELTTNIPTKENSSFVKADCDSDVNYYWDNANWGLFLKNINKKTKCNLYFQDKLELTLADDFPTEYTKGDNYPITFTYNTGSLSGNVNCVLDSSKAITNLNEIDTTGTHTITCTLTNSNNRSTSITKEIKVTYDEYKITNLIANGSFENGLENWVTSEGKFTPEIVSDAYHGNKAIKLLTDNDTDYGYASSSIIQVLNGKIPLLNHKYYAISYYKNSNDYHVADRRYEWWSGDDCTIVFGENNIPSDNWIKTASIQSPKEQCVSRTYWYIRDFIRQSNHDVIIDSLVLIDLTNDFGEGNEPTLEWLNNHISYFDDTISIYK